MVYSLSFIGDHEAMNALSAIAAPPPSLSIEGVAEAVARQFGPRGEFHPLVSERDQNFRLECADGRRFLVKVTSATERSATTDFQVLALRHLERASDVRAPRVIPTLGGASCGRIEAGGSSHRLRLLSWVQGERLQELGIDGALAQRFGRALGRLDDVLAGLSYEGENPELPWDIQRVCELRPVLACIDDAALRTQVAAAIDDYESAVPPVKSSLAHQVIHGDANPENVLLGNGAIGFIDFGDIVRAPRVFDLGIAASYLRADGDDALALIRPFVAGYHAVAALDAAEAGVLYDLVRARLATSIALLYWRLQDRPESDEYRRKSLESESNASHFLAALDSIGREKFTREINKLALQAG
jgi:Ser/Thr protein kinase RdoA (MazF antagonist)